MASCNDMDCSGCSKKRSRDPNNEVLDNKGIKNLDQLEGTLEDEFVSQVLQDLKSQETYVTGPQTSRTYFAINLASENEKTEQELIEILSTNLQESHQDIIFYIAGFYSQKIPNPKNDNKIIYQCEVCIFTIAKELIQQLLAKDIKKIYYFIGNWKEQNKFSISSHRPDDSEIAKNNYEGTELPYQSCLLNLEAI